MAHVRQRMSRDAASECRALAGPDRVKAAAR
jgi:hypothetical protein